MLVAWLVPVPLAALGLRSFALSLYLKRQPAPVAAPVQEGLRPPGTVSTTITSRNSTSHSRLGFFTTTPMAAATTPPPSTTATTTAAQKQRAREAVASEAITSKPSPVAASEAHLSPPLQAIWQSFQDNGHGDTELLKLILTAKVKEDERLKAMDELRAEQLRASQTMWQCTMYQYMLVAAAAQQQQAQAPGPLGVKPGPPPYSPLSPPSELAAVDAPATKRARATSSASVDSSASDGSRGKKAKTAPPLSLHPAQKPSHADVMAALRRKCEANQQGGGVSRSPAPTAAAAASPTYTPRPLAPAPAPVVGSRTSMSPPLSTARRTSPPHTLPGRHTSFLRPAPSPAGAFSASVLAPSPAPPASPLVTTEHTPPVPASRNKLALLLHATESSATAASFAPSWHVTPHAQAATSDVRGPVVPAPAVIAAAAREEA